mmetsp:Transcript_3809/g.11167  ORF Transcript_3809/g.11167 Transcript_3809/m.11167 type:complete len:287 (+) Transcript_3809:684-1544(+)
MQTVEQEALRSVRSTSIQRRAGGRRKASFTGTKMTMTWGVVDGCEAAGRGAAAPAPETGCRAVSRSSTALNGSGLGFPSCPQMTAPKMNRRQTRPLHSSSRQHQQLPTRAAQRLTRPVQPLPWAVHPRARAYKRQRQGLGSALQATSSSTVMSHRRLLRQSPLRVRLSRLRHRPPRTRSGSATTTRRGASGFGTRPRRRCSMPTTQNLAGSSFSTAKASPGGGIKPPTASSSRRRSSPAWSRRRGRHLAQRYLCQGVLRRHRGPVEPASSDGGQRQQRRTHGWRPL